MNQHRASRAHHQQIRVLLISIWMENTCHMRQAKEVSKEERKKKKICENRSHGKHLIFDLWKKKWNWFESFGWKIYVNSIPCDWFGIVRCISVWQQPPSANTSISSFSILAACSVERKPRKVTSTQRQERFEIMLLCDVPPVRRPSLYSSRLYSYSYRSRQ